jgi:hypothetical protein
MTRAIVVTLALLLGSAPASAGRCLQEIATIDLGIQAAQLVLTDSDKAQIMKYRKEGEELHRAGRHREAEEVLAQAMEMLLHAH